MTTAAAGKSESGSRHRHPLRWVRDRLTRAAPRSGQRETQVKLLLCGVTSVALYGIVASAYPLPRYAQSPRLYDLVSLAGSGAPGALFYAGVVVSLLLLYWLAWRTLSRAPREPRGSRPLVFLVVVFAGIAAVALVWLYPINATDLLQYFFRSRIGTVYGGSPLVDAPIRYYTDPYFYVVGEWRSIASPYGPLWELLAAAAARLVKGALLPSLIALKSLSLLSYGGCLVLVHAILGRLAPRRQVSGTLLFAWNPLILFEWIGSGHNDSVMFLFILLGIWLWTQSRHLWVLPALVLAALVKSVAVMVIPFFLLDIWLAKPGLWSRLRWLAPTLILSFAGVIVLYAPFGPLLQSLGGTLNEATGRHGFSFMMTIALFLEHKVISPLYLSGFLSYERASALLIAAYDGPRWLSLVGIAVLYLRQFILLWKRERTPIAAGAEAFFIFLALTPSYRMWYPAWAMTLAALAPSRERLLRTGMACATAQLSVLIYGFLKSWSYLARHLLGVTWTLVLPMLLPVLDRWVGRRRKRGASCGHSS